MLSLRLPLRQGGGAGMQAINAVVARTAAVALLIVCFYYASSLFWRVFYPEGFRPFVPVMGNVAVTKVTGARGKWNWFSDTAVAAKPKKPPPSRIKANLIGVIAMSKQGGKGLALIKYKGKEEIYRVGDEIAEATVLTEIAGSYVTLQRDDVTETLEIEKSTALLGDKKQKAKKGKKAGKKAPEKEDAPALPESPETVADAKTFKNLLRKEPLQLLNLFSFEQVEVGNQTGFSLSAKREDGRSMLDSVGLKEGDVVVSVNGTPASQLPSNPRLWKAVLKANKIKAKVLRDGAETQVVF